MHATGGKSFSCFSLKTWDPHADFSTRQIFGTSRSVVMSYMRLRLVSNVMSPQERMQLPLAESHIFPKIFCYFLSSGVAFCSLVGQSQCSAALASVRIFSFFREWIHSLHSDRRGISSRFSFDKSCCGLRGLNRSLTVGSRRTMEFLARHSSH